MTEACDDDMNEGSDIDEEVEISEAELQKVYESALQVEVQVKKGFSDMTRGGDYGKEKPDLNGIHDVKSGEHAWEDETPPAKQDFTVKEIRTLLARGLRENQELKAKLTRVYEIAKAATHKLHEVNLFNAKVLHCNRLLNKYGKLTTEQKKSMMESIDRARSIDEVRSIFEAIDGSFRAVNSLMESSNPRKPKANSQGHRSSGAPQQVLSESADRAGDGGVWTRMQQLAGLNKIVK
jgi:hypothetical protein